MGPWLTVDQADQGDVAVCGTFSLGGQEKPAHRISQLVQGETFGIDPEFVVSDRKKSPWLASTPPK